MFRDCPECPEMVMVPAGEFMIGSPPSEEGRWDAEDPAHRMTITAPFAAGVHEVTFDEWETCVGGGGCGGYRSPDWRCRVPLGSSCDRRELGGCTGVCAPAEPEDGEDYRPLSESEWEHVELRADTGVGCLDSRPCGPLGYSCVHEARLRSRPL